jgi:hypothetical protein
MPCSLFPDGERVLVAFMNCGITVGTKVTSLFLNLKNAGHYIQVLPQHGAFISESVKYCPIAIGILTHISCMVAFK